MASTKATIIRARPKAGPVTGFVLSALFAAAMTPIATADQWTVPPARFALGETAPVTVRVPQFSGLRADAAGLRVEGGAIVVARGDRIGPTEAAIIDALHAQRPAGATAWIAYACGFLLLALLYTGYLRRSHRGRLLRMQLVSLALTVALAAAVKTALLLTEMSVFIVPVAAAAIVAAVTIDLFAGLATALVVGVSIALMAPFDAGAIAVLVTQGMAAVLCIGDGRRRSVLVGAGIVGGIAAALVYLVFYYLSAHGAPLAELADPTRSAWLASLAGGAMSGIAALLALPVYQFLLGEITQSKLVELSDLSNPLLRQIAEKAPGTWQHSLAMANMAEIAANAIGANGRLVRVGAYYHDLGKSLQPKYYIENVPGDEQSPHDNLPPEVSCDAIFSHVTEGVRLGRKAGLPERVIDFMHMHHGDGLLEYFWAKCQEQGNPKGLTEDDFRYPGVRPQTRETAILAICDAVEAASRTLKQPDARAIENLVQRIVYGKLHLGQLDDSGLSMSDLRKISNSLVETIKHAHHVRVEYPWQREQREREARERAAREQAAEQPTVAAVPRAVAAASLGRASTTQRLANEPPLDSLDVPRSYWRRAAAAGADDIGTAPTTPVAAPPADRPDTDPIPAPGDAAARAASVDSAPAAQPAAPAPQPDPPPAPAAPDAPPARAAPTPQPDAPDAPSPQPAPAAPAPQPAAPASPAAEPASAAPAPQPAAPDAQASQPDAPAAPSPQPAPASPAAEPASAAPAPQPAAPDAPSPQPAPAAPAPQPAAPAAQADRDEPAEPAAPAPAAQPAGPPPPPRRPPKNTIELLKSGDGEPSPLTADEPTPEGSAGDGSAEVVVESHRAQSEDGLLEPGVLVVGPPPKTHTRRLSKPEDDR